MTHESPVQRPCAILVCYHFPPSIEVASRRVAAFARTLEPAGLDVLVVSAFGYATVEPGTSLWPGIYGWQVRNPRRFMVGLLVRVKRLLRRGGEAMSAAVTPSQSFEPHAPTVAAGRGLFGRWRRKFFQTIDIVDNHKKWGWLAYRQALAVARGRDVRLVVASGPPFTGVISAWLTSRRLRVPLIADFRDPLDTGLTRGDLRPSLDRRLSGLFERRIVRRAAAVTCASPGILAALQRRYARLASTMHLVTNGFDGEVRTRPAETGHRLEILFAGALYLNRDPFPLLESVERLLADPGVDPARISVRFVGDCASYNGHPLADWLASRRARQVVELIPPVTEAALQPYMERATALLNLAQGQPRQIPAKTFEHLASGCEILVLCEADSDTGRLLDTVPGVFRITPGDAAALDAALRDLYQRHALEGRLRPIAPALVAQHSRQSQNQRFLEIARSVSTLPAP